MQILLLLRGELEIATLQACEQASWHVARRCSDPAELLAAAQAGIGDVAVADDLDLSFVAALHQAGVRVVGVGVSANIRADAVASPHAAEIISCISTVQVALENHRQLAENTAATHTPGTADTENCQNSGRRGVLCAIWGTGGAPGRSCLTRDFGAASASRDPIVIDADTCNPSLAQLLHTGQETSAIVALARKIETGEGITGQVDKNLVRLRPGFRFLSGLNTGARWRELPEAVLERLWEELRNYSRLLIADCAAGLEPPSEYDVVPEHEAATRTLLEAADMRILVGKAGPVGIRRMIAQAQIARDHGLDFYPVVTHVAEKEKREIRTLLEKYDMPEVGWVRRDGARFREAETQGLPVPVLYPRAPVTGDIRRLAKTITASLEKETGHKNAQ